MKYFKELLLITLLSVFSLPTLGKKPDFSGEWYYHTTNDSREYMGNFIFKQRGNMIVGEWAEGSPQKALLREINFMSDIAIQTQIGGLYVLTMIRRKNILFLKIKNWLDINWLVKNISNQIL